MKRIERNENMDKEKIIKLTIIGLAIILILLIGLIIFNYINRNKEEAIPEEKITKIDSFSCKSASCDYELEVNNKKIPIKYELTETEEIYNLKLTIGGTKVVDENLLCGGPTFMEVFNKYIIVAYHKTCDVTGNVIAAYDSSAKEVFKYNNDLDDTNVLNIKLVNFPEEADIFKISDNSIALFGSALVDSKVYFNETETEKFVEQCNIKDREKYGIAPNYIIRGRYIILYDATKDTFSKPTFKNGTTLEDFVVCN